MTPYRYLTDRQEEILDFIQVFIDDNGYPPSIREIGDSVGISSTSVVSYNLGRLEAEGLIERAKHVARGIRVVSE